MRRSMLSVVEVCRCLVNHEGLLTEQRLGINRSGRHGKLSHSGQNICSNYFCWFHHWLNHKCTHSLCMKKL